MAAKFQKFQYKDKTLNLKKSDLDLMVCLIRDALVRGIDTMSFQDKVTYYGLKDRIEAAMD